LDTAISGAWTTAGERLGVEVYPQHSLTLNHGQCVTVEAYLPHFGGARGTALVSLEDEARSALAYASDLAVSQLSVWFRSFDVTLFKDVLNDLGWFGPNDVRPPW
jgi:hypothetical protein